MTGREFLLLAAPLFISKFCKVNNNSTTEKSGSLKSVATPYKSIVRDERGVLEPQAEILSTALAVIGFVVFAVILSQAYFGYEARSFALENYETASLLAEAVASSTALKGENSNLISASTLDRLSGPAGAKERAKFFAPFSGNNLFLIEIRTGEGKWKWKVEPDNFESDSFMEDRERVAVSIPVVIELNPAESVPGILTVFLYRADWK